MASNIITDPALTYTLDQFIASKMNDEMTFRNYSIVEVIDGLELFDHNIVEDYLSELDSLCQTIELSFEEFTKYKYAPDLLAYDVYGSTQLDFVVMYANGIIDPKEFTFKKVKLPYASALINFMSEVYNAEIEYIRFNRAQNNLTTNVY